MLIKRIVMVAWIVLAILVFFSSFEDQIILKNKTKLTLNLIFPEGWGFFTKNPREPQLKVYRINNDKMIPIDMANHSIRNYIGFSRKSRLISYEASVMLNEIPKDKWTETTSTHIYLQKIDTVIITEKKHFKHIKKGAYLFTMSKPIPYAWAKQKQEQYNPVKVVKLIINEEN